MNTIGKSEKVVAVEQYLETELIPLESRGFHYMVMIITQNMDESHSVGRSLTSMCECLATQFDTPLSNINYHLKKAMSLANKAREQKGMQRYTLRAFIVKSLNHFSNYK